MQVRTQLLLFIKYFQVWARRRKKIIVKEVENIVVVKKEVEVVVEVERIVKVPTEIPIYIDKITKMFIEKQLHPILISNFDLPCNQVGMPS